MKLFQIEEPDGSPPDPTAAGVAIGIDASGRETVVAVAIGGNAAMLEDRPGFERGLPVPGAEHGERWQELLEGARLRAERALGRPATHAVLVVAPGARAASAGLLDAAAQAAALVLLRVVEPDALPPHETPALAAAVLAEDLAPRPGG
ncbi:MAG: hypothetical protein JO038_04255 [Alphaproteobacteria bacterium]|nr:hypothetical protein [Alphaproteobacteria bacterium]